MRMPAVAVGLLVASFAVAQHASAVSGAWSLLTNDQAIAVQKKFAEELESYVREPYREAEARSEKNEPLKGLLDDLAAQRVRDDARKGTTEEERIKDNQRRLRGGADPDAEEARATRRKNLTELLDEQNLPKDSGVRKYSKQYAELLYKAYLDDQKKFAELAGEISAGEYTRVPPTLEKAGAALLTKAVSDYLDAYGYENSKAIWDGFTSGVEEYQDVGSSLLRGDWAKFRKSLKDLGYKKAKQASLDAVKETIGFAFGGGSIGAKAGSLYVKVVEAEIDFLNWSKEYLDRRLTQPCIDRYIDTYRSVGGPGGQEEAYQAFKSCSEERGKYVGFAKLEAYLVANGLDVDAVYRQMAEDIRLGNARNVADWLNGLVESRKQTVEAQWEKEFNAWSTKLADYSSKFNKASGKLINALIDEAIGEKARDELEWAALGALNDTNRDWQLLQRAAAGVTGACATFESARADALDALADARADEELAAALSGRASAFPGCTADATAITSLKRLLTRAQQVNADFDRARKSAEVEVDAACRAAETVATKTSQAEARRQLDDANARASAAGKAAEAAQAAFREIKDLSTRAAEIKPGGDRAAREQLAELADAAELLTSSRELGMRRLQEAQARMAAAVRTAQNLEGYATDRAAAIALILAPHRGSPLREAIAEYEAGIKQALDGIADCRRSISDAFTTGEGDVPSLRNRTIPALSRNELQRSVDAARAKCPDAGEDPAAIQRALADLVATADAEAAIVGLGKATYERCIAQAVVAFDGVRAAANAVLRMQTPAPDDPKYFAGKWTVADGSVTQENYAGEYIYKGTYSWNPPPANVGPQGFSITMTATCEVGPKQGGISTGVGISAEGFDVVVSATDRTPAGQETTQLPVNCATGQSNSGSATVHLVPRASYAEGEVAKIKVGAFWGAGVTYRYVAGNPQP